MRGNLGVRNARIGLQLAKQMFQEEKATKQLHDAERTALDKIRPMVKTNHPALKKQLSETHAAARAASGVQALRFPPPVVSLLCKGGGANGTSYVDAGQAPTDIMVPTATTWAQAVLNGVALGDVRFPDPFRLYPTTTTVVQYSWEFSPGCTSGVSSANPDYAFNAVFKGSAANSGWDYVPSATTTCDWKYADRESGLTYSCGMVSGDFMSRPNGYVCEIIPQLRGIEHAVSIHAMPFAPLNTTDFSAAIPTGWPAAFHLGPSPWQRYVGARSWVFKPGDSEIRLACLPLDSRGMDFALSSTERANAVASTAVAWSGWAIWGYGFTANDSVRVVTRCVDEVYPVSIGSGANYAYPASQRGSDPMVAARSVNEAIAAADAGLTGIKVVDKAIDWTVGKVGALNRIWAKLAPFVGTELRHVPMPALQSTIASGSIVSDIVPDRKPSSNQQEEEKKDDFVPVDKLRDRRNTLPEALSVDELRTPRATRK